MFTLRYQPPYDWPWMLRFLGDRAVAGIEEVSENHYRRTLASAGIRAGLASRRTRRTQR